VCGREKGREEAGRGEDEEREREIEGQQKPSGIERHDRPVS
jgi:hypothetical protein